MTDEELDGAHDTLTPFLQALSSLEKTNER